MKEMAEPTRMEGPLARVPYPLLCMVLGLALGWLPMLVHGPIPQKFNIHYVQGSIAVWGFYGARLLIGLWVGISVWPRAWYLRGPLCGVLALLPVTFIPLGMADCGFP
jgi:hypothetical protein